MCGARSYEALKCRRRRREHGRLLASSRARSTHAPGLSQSNQFRGFTRGCAKLFDTEGEPGYSASLNASMLEGYGIIRVPVRAACLGSVFAEFGSRRVDLLKIDVEKHEPAVLAGIQRHLAKDRPTLLIEILNREIGAAISKSVDGNGYRASLLTNKGA